MLGLISHPAIVQAQDLITLAGRPAVVMEYVPGVNLSWLINPKRCPSPIPLTVVLAIVRDVASALDAAYNRPSTVTGAPLEVLHRDVKPGNIRITPDGNVKILDFGIARSSQMDREAETKAHQLGSLGYMAPELLEGRGASPASDVYALGVVFYECLLRKRLGWARQTQESHDGHVAERLEAADLSEAEGAIELLTEMLAFDPERRPTTAAVRGRCRRLERNLDGPLTEEWAPEQLPRVDRPDDPDDVELTGKTLFEESSVFALTGHPADQLERATDPGGPRTSGPEDQPLADADLTMVEPIEPAAPIHTGRRARRRPWLWPAVAVVLLGVLAAVIVAARHWGRERVGLETADLVDAQPEVTPTEPSVTPTQPPAVEPMNELPEPEDPPPDEEPEPAVTAAVPAQETQPAPSTTSTKTTTARRTPAPEPPTESATPVSVRLSSIPFGIEVYVDGKSRGKTPVTIDLTPGTHTVMYLDGEDTLRTEVDVQATGGNLFNYVRAEGKLR